MSWLRPFLIRVRHSIVKNAPHILMGMGTTGSITAVIFAIQATPAASQAKKDAQFVKAHGHEPEEGEIVGIFAGDMPKLTVGETVKVCGKYYIPAVGLELFSLMCFWGAHGINMKRQAVLAGLYSTAEAALNEYQRKVMDMFGKDVEKEVRTGIAQDRLNSNPPPSMIFDSDADCWCYYRGYKFRSNYRKLKDIQNEANAEMIKNLYISESDLLWMFDSERRWIVPDPNSRLVGFVVDRLMEFDILPTLTPDREPALEVNIRDKDGREYFPQPGYSASL